MIAHAQWIDEGDEVWARLNFPKAWTSYLYDTKADLSILRLNYFRDTISLEEMKTAFEDYKDSEFKVSPYAGYDSISTYYGKLLVLISPLKGTPIKDVWMMQHVNKKKAKLLTGDIVFLQSPMRYMGYTVSPNPILETRKAGYLKVDEGNAFAHCADFFSYMSPSFLAQDCAWGNRVKGGAKLLGTLIGMDTYPDYEREERTFSVLLYEKPKCETNSDEIYKIELLSPKDPDWQIQTDFGNMRRFVSTMPYGTFRPLYTTDFRILTGRYYRVTVNKFGWLIEDYMTIKH